MSEFDDGKLIGAMRAFLRANDELTEAAAAASGEGSRDIIDKAELKTLAELTLRKQLENAGWIRPNAVPADKD